MKTVFWFPQDNTYKALAVEDLDKARKMQKRITGKRLPKITNEVVK